MVAGRPRKPRDLHVAAGTYREDRHGGNKEPVATGRPKKPRGLDKLGAALWKKMVPGLIEMGVCKESDETALTMMCQWYSQYARAMEANNIQGAATAWDKFNKIASRFGYTPSDRARLTVEPADTADPLLQMMGE